MTNLAETDRGFLGLTHNPFVQPEDGFFEQADRKSHLEQLRHLSQWSRRVLLVTGPPGVGKTALYRQLSATLEPRCKAARIPAGLVNASREVLLAVARGFGIAAPADANTQLLIELIRDHVEDQARAERVCVVLVDDADHLEPRALVDLMTLARDCRVQLAFFAEVRVVPAVERAAGRLGLGWHEIRLTGFSEQQTREYLEWRFQQARYRGRLPFTDSQVKEIYRQSQGLPGKINQLANVLLVRLQTGDIGRTDAAFPAVHRALLLLLVVVVGLLYLLWQQSEDVEAPVERTADVVREEPALDEALVAAADKLVAHRAADPRTAPDEEATVDAPEPTDPAASTVAGPGHPAAMVSAEQSALLAGSAGKTPTPAPEAPTDPAAAPAAAKDAPDRPRNSQPREAAAGSSQGGETTVVVAGTQPTREPEAAGTSSGTGSHDGRWLLSQPAESYTLQLVTVSSAERAARFIDAQADPTAFSSYKLARDGRVLHVVCYGVFPSRSEAEAAARRLPASVGKVKPWIRTLAQVHGAIRTTGQ